MEDRLNFTVIQKLDQHVSISNRLWIFFRPGFAMRSSSSTFPFDLLLILQRLDQCVESCNRSPFYSCPQPPVSPHRFPLCSCHSHTGLNSGPGTSHVSFPSSRAFKTLPPLRDLLSQFFTRHFLLILEFPAPQTGGSLLGRSRRCGGEWGSDMGKRRRPLEGASYHREPPS